MKDELRFTTIADGEQSVIIPGILRMLVLSADSLAFKMLRLHMERLTLAKELDRSCWIALIAQASSHRYRHAFVMNWVMLFAVTVKMLEYALKALEVKINDKELQV